MSKAEYTTCLDLHLDKFLLQQSAQASIKRHVTTVRKIGERLDRLGVASYQPLSGMQHASRCYYFQSAQNIQLRRFRAAFQTGSACFHAIYPGLCCTGSRRALRRASCSEESHASGDRLNHLVDHVAVPPVLA